MFSSDLCTQGFGSNLGSGVTSDFIPQLNIGYVNSWDSTSSYGNKNELWFLLSLWYYMSKSITAGKGQQHSCSLFSVFIHIHTFAKQKWFCIENNFCTVTQRLPVNGAEQHTAQVRERLSESTGAGRGERVSKLSCLYTVSLRWCVLNGAEQQVFLHKLEGERVSCELELLGQSIVLFLYQPVIQLSSGQKR